MMIRNQMRGSWGHHLFFLEGSKEECEGAAGWVQANVKSSKIISSVYRNHSRDGTFAVTIQIMDDREAMLFKLTFG